MENQEMVDGVGVDICFMIVLVALSPVWLVMAVGYQIWRLAKHIACRVKDDK